MNENFHIYSSTLLFVKPLYRKTYDINVHINATVRIYQRDQKINSGGQKLVLGSNLRVN